ncbi:MerR family transcriptional regulator [Priestia megaterium]|uniref:MerR family transcriptional regulator n=1 Tax=Priestia megaterium TaxID=1404 RepID=UPI003CC6DC05
MNKDSTTGIAYKSSEVERLLGTSSSNLRKWCMILENEGYEFVRGTNRSRLFYNQDVVVLKRLKELVQIRGMALEGAANALVSLIETEKRTTSVPEANDLEEQHSNVFVSRSELKQIFEKLDAQEQFNKLLLERLEQQQSLMNQQINNRDEQLLGAIRTLTDSHKQIAANLDSPKKGFFARLFGK